MASLYHRWSAASADAKLPRMSLAWASISASTWRNAPNGKRKLGGIEPDALQLAMPSEIGLPHQITRGDSRAVGQAPFPQRHLDGHIVRMKWIEIDGDQDHVAPISRHFAVE